jgi:hypothetical protein
MRRLVMLSSLALLSGCAEVSSRPCPQVTEFPPTLQRQAVEEMRNAPALTRMMDAMAVDRAFNRAVCK